VPARTLKDELLALEARQDELRELLAKPEPDRVLIHPGLARAYRRRVAALHEPLEDQATRVEAMELMTSFTAWATTISRVATATATPWSLLPVTTLACSRAGSRRVSGAPFFTADYVQRLAEFVTLQEERRGSAFRCSRDHFGTVGSGIFKPR
jgi:hypothetical protein